MRVVIAGGHGKIALLLERFLAERGDQAVGLIRNPVGFQNSAGGPDLGFYAARSYSLMRPPRTGRRLVLSWERSATGRSGRGGRSCRPR
jgi:hypothetical protein